MRSAVLVTGVPLLLALATVVCSDGGSKITAQTRRTPSAAPARSEGARHVMMRDDDLNWGPAPPIFPPGAMFAVLQGDPSVTGQIFTVRLRFPNGYILPPHWHPTDEAVTVLRGTFLVGMGDVYSADALHPFRPGDFIVAPQHVPHYASARGLTEVQVHAMGPFQLTYVNPADDPTKQ